MTSIQHIGEAERRAGRRFAPMILSAEAWFPAP